MLYSFSKESWINSKVWLTNIQLANAATINFFSYLEGMPLSCILIQKKPLQVAYFVSDPANPGWSIPYSFKDVNSFLVSGDLLLV